MAVADKKRVFFTAWNQHRMQGLIPATVPDPDPADESHPIPGRGFRMDVAWPPVKLGVEIQGGGYKGKHMRLIGYETDCAKNNLAALHGWRVLAFTPQMIERDPAHCIEVVLQGIDPTPGWHEYLALKWKTMTGRIPKAYTRYRNYGWQFATITHLVGDEARRIVPDGFNLRVDLLHRTTPNYYAVQASLYRSTYSPNEIFICDGAELKSGWQGMKRLINQWVSRHAQVLVRERV